MEQREYTTHDRTNWGSGPWDGEPDKVQFVDEATKLPCLAVRNHHGAWCGYVGVPPGHKFFEVPYRDLSELDVHGGLTFADHCRPAADESHGICHVPAAGEPDHVWWLGFDCNHSGDFAPGARAMLAQLGLATEVEKAIARTAAKAQYRTLGYIRNQCAYLAAQISGA